jgi:hypothetical protein
MNIFERRTLTHHTAIVLVVLISWFGFVDTYAVGHINDQLVNASVAFGLAKLINGLVSFFQSIQVGVSVGFQVSAEVLQILDPLNDVVEDFSSLMKLSIGSLIAQKILIGIFSSIAFKVVITVIGGFLIASFYFAPKAFFIFFKGFIFVGFLRFMLASVVLLYSIVDHGFLNKQADDGATQMQELGEILREANGHDKTTVSREEQIKVEADLEQFTLEFTALTVDRSELISLIAKLQGELADALSRKDAVKEDIREKKGYLESMNLFAGNPELDELEREINETKTKLKTLEERQEGIDDRISDINESMTQAKGVLSGDIDGSSMITKLKSYVDIQDNFDNIDIDVYIRSMIDLMVIFAFKTIIIPIFFAFFLIKAFRAMWNIDPRTLIREQFQNIKENHPDQVQVFK